MSLAIDIIKRSGNRPSEAFTADKLYSSVLAACLSVRTPIGQAEMTARAVCGAVTAWLNTKPEVTSHDIRRITTQHLTQYEPEAAYLYEQHRITI